MMSSEGFAVGVGHAEMDPQGAAERMAKQAQDAPPEIQLRCSVGGEVMFYLPDTRARLAGHVYSVAGLNEVNITEMCEFHFDAVTQPEDDEDEVIEEASSDPRALEPILITAWDGTTIQEFLDDDVRKGE